MGVWSSDPGTGGDELSLRTLVGLVPDLLNDDPMEVAATLRDRFGYTVRIPPIHPALDEDVSLVTHPDDVQQVLQTAPTSFERLDVPASRDFHRVVSDSIVSLSSSEGTGGWLERTRMLRPEFTEDALAAHVPELAATVSGTVAEFEEGPGGLPDAAETALPEGVRIRPTGGDGVLLLPAMRRLTLRMLGVSLLGRDLRSHEAAVLDAVETLRSEFKRRQVRFLRSRVWRHLPREVRLPSWLGRLGAQRHSIPLRDRRERPIRDAVGTLEAVAEAVADRRGETPLLFEDALTTWLLRVDDVTGRRLDPATLRQEVIGLVIAGHATTSAGLTWTLWLLASRPGVQGRIHEEASDLALFADHETVADAEGIDPADPHAAVDGREVVGALPYTRRVWQEAIRLYPPLPMFGRTVSEDVTVGGVDLAAGEHVVVSPYVTHRDPAFWDRPERFDPGRFRPERAADRHEFAYFPFSGGPHACLGRSVATTEAVVALATIMQRYRLEFADADPPDAPRPSPDASAYVDQPVGIDSAINLQPDADVTVRFVPRE